MVEVTSCGAAGASRHGCRVLVVNADDFGRTHGINAGVARAHEEGIVTSASLMVRWPAAVDAVAYTRAHPKLSVGLHVDLGEWRWVDGRWRTTYEVVSLASGKAVARELRRQLERFRDLVGADPTHVDSHQHAHRAGAAAAAVAELGSRLGVPVRGLAPWIRYCGDFYGQSGRGERVPERVTTDALLRLIQALQPGITELGCHPAARGDVPSVYAAERVLEVEALCSWRVAAAVADRGIKLRSFKELGRGEALR